MNNINAGIDENTCNSNQSSVLFSDNLININEKQANLLKINPFQKNIKTKIETQNHNNQEYVIKKIKNNSNKLNPIQEKLIEVIVNESIFEIKERKITQKIENSNSEFDYSRKSIVEVKTPLDNSNLIDDLKKKIDNEIKNLQNNQNEKIDETLKKFNYKINEQKKEILIEVDEKIEKSKNKLIEKIDISTKNKLDEMKKNILRS